MKNYIEDALYHPDGELWLLQEKNHFKVGVTDFGQEFFRAVKKVTFPEIAVFYSLDEWMASIQTDKVDTDLFFPVSGKLLEINPILIDNPALINESALDKGWLLKLGEVPKADLNLLINAAEYQKLIASFFNK